MTTKRKLLAALIIAVIVAVAITYGYYNKAQAYMIKACWASTTPGDMDNTQGLWSINSDGTMTKIRDNGGWINLPTWQVQPGDECGGWMR